MTDSSPFRGLLDLLFPPKCSLCGRPGADALCHACIESFSLLSPPYCSRCGCPLVGEISCTRCRKATPAPDIIRAFGIYEDSLRKAIHTLKYRGRARLGEPLGRLLADYVSKEPDLLAEAWDAVLPIPIHPARQRQRGFNQSELIARPLAQELDAPLETGWLVRTRRTAPQARLPREKRLPNIQGAYRVNNATDIKGKRILIVDDVLTTGSTIGEAARTLREAGAKTTGALALAMDL